MKRLALFGGIYNNHLALAAAIEDARRRNADDFYCLGDLGAFGPYPDRVYPILREHSVQCIQGNYDNSLAGGLADCQCGYTDPRDNHFARVSYNYTFKNTSADNKAWLRTLPETLSLEVDGRRVLLCHGSPRRMNEFLWESTSPDSFLEHLLDQSNADVICVTHTGIKWHRELPAKRHFINVGVLGRPENDGATNVWYTLLAINDGEVKVEFVPVDYDFEKLAGEMRTENLPAEFIETILSGWWTTCLEVLPHKERARGRF
ncbi:MAG: metallophosphoesterase [Acidobacteria bacterium]|nr:MAG: metallophosphoesterase [Acidobacteriota bacterium]